MAGRKCRSRGAPFVLSSVATVTVPSPAALFPAQTTVTLWGPPAAVAVLQAALDGLAGPGGLRLVAQGDLPGAVLDRDGGAVPDPNPDLNPNPDLARQLDARLTPLLTAQSGAPVVILYPDLAQSVAPVLAAIGDPEVPPESGPAADIGQMTGHKIGLVQGMAQWCALAEALLALWARHRRRLILMPAADLMPTAAPQVRARLIAALAARLGLPASGPTAAPGSAPGSAPESGIAEPETMVTALARLLAAGLGQTRPDLRDVLGRLEAAGLLLASRPDSPAPEAPEASEGAGGPGTGLRAAMRTLGQVQATTEARALAQQNRLHALALRRQEMATEAAMQEARRQVDKLEERIAGLQAAQAPAEAAARVRLEELAAATAAAEAGWAAALSELSLDHAGDLQAAERRAADQLADLQAALVQGQAAAVAEAVAEAVLAAEQAALPQARAEAGAALAEQRAEAQTALHAVTTTAEGRLVLQGAELARLAADLDSETRAAAAQLADIGQLARDIALRDGRIRMLAGALQSAEDEVTALRASHSWRVTAPLRAVSLAVRRLKP